MDTSHIRCPKIPTQHNTTTCQHKKCQICFRFRWSRKWDCDIK